MAAFKRLLSQTGRRCFPDPTPPPNHHLVYLLRRHFSIEPQPSPNPEPSTERNANLRNPIPIQPVSYPTKPRPPPSEENQQESPSERQTSSLDSQHSVNRETRSWTRDEMRYMKDAPVISPVSYPSRVAPLPEDRMKVGEEEKGDRNAGLEMERRKIEEYRRRGVLAYGKVEEEESLPFPKLVKVENTDQNSKKKGKVIYDLKEAIQLVKLVLSSDLLWSQVIRPFEWDMESDLASFIEVQDHNAPAEGSCKASAKKTFDETLEAHVRMTPDLRRTDLINSYIEEMGQENTAQKVKRQEAGWFCAPSARFWQGAAADEARDAGADIVGGPELVENIWTGQLKVDFDMCIATPSMMEHVKKFQEVAIMSNKHLKVQKGTLTNDISRKVKEAKEPSVHFKKDKTAIVHVGLGKISFPEDALRDNVGAFVNALLLEKPAGLKKSKWTSLYANFGSKYAGYVDSFHICSTMGPSFPISIQSLSMAADRYTRLQMQ
ncbi:hypothetical protein DH2020_022659 [Rehmannia glutinosa]|uniref:Uncharacterized protein n=1 Tax=Rehmannia glutinosa TaxID=99300 RepID=A0ABR0W3S6_REHGL